MTTTMGAGTAPGATDESVTTGDWTVTGDLTAKTGRTATYVIAASNAPAHVKAQADYPCDGTADDVQIQAAIDDLATISGGSEGICQLSEGMFYLTQGLNIAGSVWLRGSGRGATFLEQVAGSNLPSLIRRDASVDYHIHLSDFTLDGKKATNPTAGYGIDVTRMNSGLLEDIRVVDCKDYCIFGETSGGAEADGIRLLLVSASGSDAGGIQIKNAAGWHLTDVASNGNATYSFYFNGGGEHFLTALEADGIGDGTAYVFSTCARIRGANMWAASTGGGSAFLFAGTNLDMDFSGVTGDALATAVLFSDGVGYTNTNILFRGLFIARNVGGIGLRFDSAQTTYSGVQIRGGAITVGTVVNAGNVPTGVSIKDINGYVTENHGTATLLNGQTSVVFAHGMAITPTHVSISWKENPTNVIADWWWSADGTNITVNGVDPGATNLDFSWDAK
jgi:hypothetical protein